MFKEIGRGGEVVGKIGIVLFVGPLVWAIGCMLLGALLQLDLIFNMAQYALIGMFTGPIGILLMAVGGSLSFLKGKGADVEIPEEQKESKKRRTYILLSILVGTLLVSAIATWLQS